MKKQLVYMGLIITAVQYINAAAPSLEKLELALTGAHTRAFSKENLITERLMPDDSAKWNEAVSAIGAYISANAPDLKEIFAQLNTMSMALVNTLQSTFGAYIAPALKASKKSTGGGLKRENFEKITSINFEKAYANLSSIKGDELRAQQIQKDLDKSPSTASKIKALFGSSTNNDAKSILKRLALTLELTIAKVFIDFNKLKQLAAQ